MYKEDSIHHIKSLELTQRENYKNVTEIKTSIQIIADLKKLRKEKQYFDNEAKKLNFGFFFILISIASFISVDSRVGTIFLAIGIPLTTILGLVRETNKTMSEDIDIEITRRRGALLFMKTMKKNFIILPEHHRYNEGKIYENSISHIIFDRDIKTFLSILSVALGIYILFNI
jgi:hypothetical protein